MPRNTATAKHASLPGRAWPDESPKLQTGAVVIVASWLIAFVEYCMAVPANRAGSAVYSTAQLKTIQEVVTLLVFAGFSVVYLKEPMTWNYAVGFALVAAGAFFIFRGPL
jgi:uncharacterized protein